MDLKDLDKADLMEAISKMETLDEVRAAATELGVLFAPAAKIASLKGKIIDFLDSDNAEADDESGSMNELDDILSSVLNKESAEEQIQISKIKRPAPLSDHDLILMDHNHIEDVNLRRRVVRAKALRMMRVRVQSMDPSDAQLNGVIITARNKYTGKISKYVPFASEVSNGYYVPKMILDHMAELKFPRRVEKKGSKFGIKQYNTVMSPKYTIEYLPHLSKREIEKLADAQRASGAIDQTELSS